MWMCEVIESLQENDTHFCLPESTESSEIGSDPFVERDRLRGVIAPQ